MSYDDQYFDNDKHLDYKHQHLNLHLDVHDIDNLNDHYIDNNFDSSLPKHWACTCRPVLWLASHVVPMLSPISLPYTSRSLGNKLRNHMLYPLWREQLL